MSTTRAAYSPLFVLLTVFAACLAAARPAAAACGGTPTVTTDKGDYAPTETVMLSGSGFNCAEELTVLITAPDGTTLSGDGTGSPGPDVVVTNDEGGFTLGYRLSGTLPGGGGYAGQFGQYLVEVRDGAGTILAGGVFRDGQGYHSCAVTTSGGVKCWGNNASGQLGDGTLQNRLTPVDVPGLSGVLQISTGYDHTCALLAGGGVKCWGANSLGQLGDGTLVRRAAPTDVAGLTGGVMQISAGLYSTCAVLTTGVLKCWGTNQFGKLGDGTLTDRRTPVEVIGLPTGVVQVSSTYYHVCAVTTSGGVKCWGLGSNGQLGNGSTTSQLTPVDVAGLSTGIVQVRTGIAHSCALSAGGSVKCWGAGHSGELGNGSFSFRTTPVDVTSIPEGATQLSVGWQHSCALTTAGSIKCWGVNWAGMLGDGTATPPRGTLVDVVGLARPAEQVSAGAYHTCAVSAGAARCWGANGDGQLGDGARTARFAPVTVVGLTTGVAALWDGGASVAVDHMAPAAAPSQWPAANAAGWNNTNVTITWNWNDAGVGIDPDQCPPMSTSSGEGAPLLLQATCADRSRNVGTASYALKVDKTLPAIAAAASTPPTVAGWYNNDVTVTFTCTDTLSGIAACPSPQILSGEGAAISSSARSEVDLAGNESALSNMVTVKIDRTPPLVSLIGGPTSGATFYFAAVPSAPACSASDALSGLDGGCTVSGYSTAVGSHTVSATAKDHAGNQSRVSVTYTVLPWSLAGFYQPVDMGDVWNTVKGGSTIPIKFEVFSGATELSDTAAVLALAASQISCAAGATDEIEVLAPGETGLRYDTAAGHFIYNWHTPRISGACYVVRVTLRDGTWRSAKIQLR